MQAFILYFSIFPSHAEAFLHSRHSNSIGLLRRTKYIILLRILHIQNQPRQVLEFSRPVVQRNGSGHLNPKSCPVSPPPAMSIQRLPGVFTVTIVYNIYFVIHRTRTLRIILKDFSRIGRDSTHPTHSSPQSQAHSPAGGRVQPLPSGGEAALCQGIHQHPGQPAEECMESSRLQAPVPLQRPHLLPCAQG